ncbi:MAG TPA: hypothetical protein VFH73_05115 [Polyangia bacterium]|nr:hypothetical protein [Polyangia bacterium]
MSMLGTVKDVLVGRAMQIMSDPRMSRLMSDPRLMTAAMKAMNLGGSVKSELDKATRFAASVFGLATQDEVTALRSTIQQLEDTIAILESKTATDATAAAGTGAATAAATPGGPARASATP